MLKKIRLILMAVFASLLFLPAVVPAAVGAAEIQRGLCDGADDLRFDTNPENNACTTLRQAGDGSATSTVNDLITDIVNIISVIVGIIAVIMIIWGGLRYITSGGDSTKVGNAKNTILYALIGLIIVALAQVIVKFVLSKATTE